MKHFLKSALNPTLTILAFGLLVSVPANAFPTAPEVDPGVTVAGVTFLAGALMVLRSRRRK